MEKRELKIIISKLFDDLNTQIDSEEEISKEQIVNFFRRSADIFSINDLETISEKNLFSNAYKEIAKCSLESYNATNRHLDSLNRQQIETLTKCDPSLELHGFAKDFLSIHQNMSSEIDKANNTIAELNSEIRRLERKSNIDSLTKIYNRGALNSYLSNICNKDKKSYDMYLLMLDIDDFKNFNDTHGHVAGDKALIYIANLLKSTLRGGDRAFRYGGEEFTIILNRTDDEGCDIVVKRILKLIRESKLKYNAKEFSLTLSIGVARLRGVDTPETLIQRADKALYMAKRRGKNRSEMDI
jgi:diguanylate cyclase (GGDEF)-like protein